MFDPYVRGNAVGNKLHESPYCMQVDSFFSSYGVSDGQEEEDAMRYCLVSMGALLVLCTSTMLDAQVHVQINVGSQPDWGPAGYDYVEYYYLPDIDVYYSVPQHCYYYYGDGRWIRSSRLPERYHDYDPYHSYKVVVNEREPWRHHEDHRGRYASFRDRHDQEPIRDSRGSRDHPGNKHWKEERHDNGKHKGWGKRD